MNLHVRLEDLSPEETAVLEKVVNDAYDSILTSANIVLIRCLSTSLNITYLRAENPTLGEILKRNGKICSHMQYLQQHGYITSKAEEYVLHVKNIVKAVEEHDQDSLVQYVDDLNRRSFL